VVDILKDMTNPAEKFEYVYPKKPSCAPTARPFAATPADPQGGRNAPGGQASRLYSGGGVILATVPHR
jgi:hypothetical protein